MLHQYVPKNGTAANTDAKTKNKQKLDSDQNHYQIQFNLEEKSINLMVERPL